MEIEQRRSSGDKDWPFSYFKFDETRDSPDQARSALLVVAALIAAASFQAITNPSDAIIKGTPVQVVSFICSNTLAWSASMTTIEFLTDSFPFQREIRISYFAMGYAFGVSAGALGDLTKTRTNIVYILFSVCLLLPWAARSIPACIKRVCCCK